MKSMENSRSPSTFQIGNLAALIGTVIVNAFTNILPFKGKNVGEISNSYPNLFTPANYVFSIWGAIYALLFAFGVYQALPGQKEKPFMRKIGYLFILSCVANIVWIFIWSYELIVISVAPMFLLLASLILIYLRLDIGRAVGVTRGERLFIHLPFSVYLGWITVAPIANIAAALVSVSWNGFGISEIIWTRFMIIIATLLTWIVILKRRDIGYSLVIIWAFVGIIFKQTNISQIVLTAAAGIVTILITLIYSRWPRARELKIKDR